MKKLIRRPALEKIIGHGRTWITDTLNPDSKRYDPTFPKPFKFANSQTNIWVSEEIYQWVDTQISIGRKNPNHEQGTG